MNDRTTLRIGGVPEHFNLPWHRGIESGAFQDLEFDIEFIEYPGGTGAMTRAMSEGDLDIALLLFEGAVTNILRGHDNRIVKVYVQSPLIWGIHVAADSDIESVDEIQDRVYAISRAGSGSHLIAIVDAAERGWPTDNMKFSKVDNLDGAREKLANGKVDVFLWERFTTQPLVDNGEFRRVSERLVPWPAFVVSVREDILEQHSEGIRNLLERVDQCCAEFKSNDGAAWIVSEKFDIKLEDAAAWFDLVEWNQDFDRPDETIQRIIGYLEQLKIIQPNGAGPDDVWHSLPEVSSS